MKMKLVAAVTVFLSLSSIGVVDATPTRDENDPLPGGATCSDADDINAAITESPTNEDDLVRDLLDWLIENGAYVNDKVQIRHMVIGDPLSPRGIFATDDMDVGETVCRIPWDLILKPNDKEEGGVGSEVTTSYNDPICATFDAVADAMSDGGKTPYGAYLLAQPKDYTPAFWSQAARDLMRDMLQSRRPRSKHLTELDQLPPRGIDDLFDRDIAQNCNGRVNDPLYRQAVMLVVARADYQYLVPFYDINNHHNGKNNMAHRYNPYDTVDLKEIKKTGYELVTTKAIKRSEELRTSYNHGLISDDWLDWFGTPEMFLYFGFVEDMPQRWLFDFARVKFDLDWTDVGESTGNAVVNFLVPPSIRGIELLKEELARLTLFAKKHRDAADEDAGILHSEWTSLWQYYDALYYALSCAIKQGGNETLIDDVWINDNWWVKDGTLTAADVGEHQVFPTKYA